MGEQVPGPQDSHRSGTCGRALVDASRPELCLHGSNPVFSPGFCDQGLADSRLHT